MRFIIAMIVMMFWSSQPAKAEDTIVDACHAAAAFLFTADKSDMKIANIQSFPELTPPRVNFLMIESFNGVFSCQFKSNTKPYQIEQLCLDRSSCLSTGEERFEEVRTLLKRAGY